MIIVIQKIFCYTAGKAYWKSGVKMIKIPSGLIHLSNIFKKNGHTCYLVGGAVRDFLLGRKVNDFDLATDALPKKIIRMFNRVIPTGIKHGTVTVLFENREFEITTFRVDGKYSNGRHPDSVEFTPSIIEDLRRRDFTINAIAFDIQKRKILDPFSGREDLKKGIIRAIGNPEDRFTEDALRTLRACRFMSQLGFEIEESTEKAIKKLSGLVENISAERIRDEFIKLIMSPAPSRGIKFLKKNNLLKFILPELEICAGVEQPEMHSFDVFEHCLYSCDAAERDLLIRLAALFHDIGKPSVFQRDPNDRIRFYGHEKESSKITKRILTRLKFPNKTVKAVSHLILHHMFGYDSSWTDSAVRRFVKRVGLENINNLFALRRADSSGMNRTEEKGPDSMRGLLEFSDRIEKVLARSSALSVNDLAIDGNDLMKALSIPPGEKIGIILKYLMECVMDSPEQNEKSRLLKIAVNFYNERMNLE